MDWLPIGMGMMMAKRSENVQKQEPDEDQTELQMESPTGWVGTLRGNTAMVMFLLIQVIGFWWLLRTIEHHEEEAQDRLGNLFQQQLTLDREDAQQAQRRQAQILENQIAILKTANETLKEARLQTYIATLNDKQRAELNLTIPQELLDRRRGR